MNGFHGFHVTFAVSVIYVLLSTSEFLIACVSMQCFGWL